MKNIRLMLGVLMAGAMFASPNLFPSEPVKAKPSKKPLLDLPAVASVTKTNSAESGPGVGQRFKPLPDVPKEIRSSNTYERPTRGRNHAQP